jgi:carboxypeptidase C (cathepsin A)
MGRSLTLKARMRLPVLLLPLLQLVVNLPCYTSKKRSHRSLPDPSDLRVKGLEEVEPAFGLFEGEMYAGLLPMDNGDRTGNLMFWLFIPEEPSVSDSLVIWLNGGPGTYLPSFRSGV